MNKLLPLIKIDIFFHLFHNYIISYLFLRKMFVYSWLCRLWHFFLIIIQFLLVFGHLTQISADFADSVHIRINILLKILDNFNILTSFIKNFNSLYNSVKSRMDRQSSCAYRLQQPGIWSANCKSRTCSSVSLDRF